MNELKEKIYLRSGGISNTADVNNHIKQFQSLSTIKTLNLTSFGQSPLSENQKYSKVSMTGITFFSRNYFKILNANSYFWTVLVLIIIDTENQAALKELKSSRCDSKMPDKTF